MRISKDIQQRFWANVRKSKHPDGCWLWTAGTTTEGYGRFWINGRYLSAHRVSYGLWRHLRDTDILLHECDVRLCVRPKHLTPGNHSENNLDMHAKRRGYRGGTKLTVAIVQRMRRLHRKGLNKTEIARKVGVDRRTAARAIDGLSWRKVS